MTDIVWTIVWVGVSLLPLIHLSAWLKLERERFCARGHVYGQRVSSNIDEEC